MATANERRSRNRGLAEISTAEAAALVGRSAETARRWCVAGLFPCRFAPRALPHQIVPAWRIRRASFLRWWRNRGDATPGRVDSANVRKR